MPTRRTDFLNEDKIPTIDDLRVKECYICRDEERFDDPSPKHREWVHPCKCTLIAHQSCLMKLLSHRPESRPKCPQCAHEYQTERNPAFLGSSMLFRVGDTIFQAMGTSFIAASAIGLGTLSVASAFAVGTGYGAIAVREYFGAELFDLVLTEEPTNWQIRHYLLFFLTPLRLVSPFIDRGAFTTLFFLLPRTPPTSVREQLAAESRIKDVSFSSPSETAWRPGLTMFGCIVFGTSMVYSRLFPRFAEWVLDMKIPKRRRDTLFRGLTFRRWIRRREGQNGEVEGGLQLQREVPEDTDSPFANLNGVTQYHNISIMAGLLKPFIASGMGRLLYLGAQHSSTLRQFLGIQSPLYPMYTSPKLVPELYESKMYWRSYTETTIQHMDPVWIRNSIGLGIFVVLRDCVHLFHLWLTKRELNSRKLKNRDFSGVDPKELDLINPVPHPTYAS